MIHLLIVMFLLADGLIQGWMGAEDVISLGGFELSASTIYFSLSIYNGKQIVYIEIERKTAIIMDVRKRQYVLPFHEIDHIVYTSDKCVIKMKNSQISQCRASGYLTLAAVAKCLQAATWLVARGIKVFGLTGKSGGHM